jgi:prefoldin subunit 5
VNFAAVKALEARTAELRAKSAEVDRLTAEVSALRQRQDELEAMVRSLVAQQQH